MVYLSFNHRYCRAYYSQDNELQMKAEPPIRTTKKAKIFPFGQSRGCYYEAGGGMKKERNKRTLAQQVHCLHLSYIFIL